MTEYEKAMVVLNNRIEHYGNMYGIYMDQVLEGMSECETYEERENYLTKHADTAEMYYDKLISLIEFKRELEKVVEETA